MLFSNSDITSVYCSNDTFSTHHIRFAAIRVLCVTKCRVANNAMEWKWLRKCWNRKCFNRKTKSKRITRKWTHTHTTRENNSKEIWTIKERQIDILYQVMRYVALKYFQVNDALLWFRFELAHRPFTHFSCSHCYSKQFQFPMNLWRKRKEINGWFFIKSD